ncbi:MAG: EAL domain-containing protein, partial [Planctomycetaceae bacterium]|nr:EAL domain-containing protein [Planctomycetaceae bacterium]
CFQSIHNPENGHIVGYEFLARSSFPGLESAGRIFQQATATRLEVELSCLCRDKALQYSTVIDAAIPVFLNTHPAESLLDVTVPHLRQLRNTWPERAIVLEIHEAAITEPELIRNVRQELREIDVRIAFDDFGKGQARIRELISSSADFVKFDADLIRDLDRLSSEQRLFFRTIIDGIRKEGVTTIAEGIETPSMAVTCREIGFDLLQGYLYSRPTMLQ